MSGAATRFRLILFDFDGTLVDSQHAIVEAMGTAFADADLDRPGAAAVRRIVGLGLEEAVRVLIDGMKGNTGGPAGVAGIAESYRRAAFDSHIGPDPIDRQCALLVLGPVLRQMLTRPSKVE